MNLSASLIVDKTLSPNVHAFRTRFPSVWVPDSKSYSCYSCKEQFGFMKRKHHCRICNRCFCYSCCHDFETPISYLNTWAVNVRMCKTCTKNQREAKEVEVLIIVFAAMPLSMEEKWKCRLIDTRWSKAWTHFSDVRNVQYKLPHLKYNKLEQLWLENNGHEMDKHSMLSVAYANHMRCLPTVTKDRISCRRLMCSSQCRRFLNESDVLQLVTQKVKFKHRLQQKWMIPWNIRNGIVAPTIENLMELRIAKHKEMYDRTLVQLTKEDKAKWNNMCKLFATINKLIQYNDKAQRKSIKEELFAEIFVLHYPMDNKRLIVDILTDNIVDIDSNSKPVVIPFLLSDNTLKHVLVKKEDIRNDRLAQTTLMWICRLSGMHMNTYSVIPTSDKSGWIEIFEDCTTLYDIKYTKQSTIMHYIMENNPKKTAYAIKRDFIKSVAISCVLSYVLGLGDRHLENIIVTASGQLIHIDFGFIFGSDPHKAPSEMRITKQTLEALGGVHSKSFQTFSERCEAIYKCVRKAAPLWYALFKHRIGEERAYQWISERLIPGEFDSAAATKIVDIVHRNSSTSWVRSILDTTRVVRKSIGKLRT